MADPISFLIFVIVVCVLLYLLFYVLNLMPIPSQIRTVIIVIVALLCIVWLLQRSGVLTGL
jgi:hypothetical protein